jgi:outer membrane usher protein FimD/PapC
MVLGEPSSFWTHAAPEWLAGIGTVAVALIAVFQEWFKRLVVRPKLMLDARVARPDAEKFAWDDPHSGTYYFRLAVNNNGTAEAHNVQLYVASVKRQRQDGQYERVARFSPMNLLWTHINKPTLPVLLPKMPPRYCDLAYVCDPRGKTHSLPDVAADQALLALKLEVEAQSQSYLLEPGHLPYELETGRFQPTASRLHVGSCFSRQVV